MQEWNFRQETTGMENNGGRVMEAESIFSSLVSCNYPHVEVQFEIR